MLNHRPRVEYLDAIQFQYFPSEDGIIQLGQPKVFLNIMFSTGAVCEYLSNMTTPNRDLTSIRVAIEGSEEGIERSFGVF